MSPRHLAPQREAEFPNLRRQDYQVTSDEDWRYNCMAYAAGKNTVWWWPVGEETEGVFWPEGVPRIETLEAFIVAFHTEGYTPCEDGELEEGFEKIALYVDADGKPAHAAKQLSSGSWTSKLGEWEDIEHKTLDSISCPTYGIAISFLRRKISEPTTPRPAAPS